MFTKILVANRGEIAVRVMRTAQKLGIRTVAVYSAPDADALHVRMADEAVPLGGGPAADNYLNAEKIIAAALSAEAQAIHPGYGFLSENAAFARAVTEAGLIFIGPPDSAIDAMGEKIAARSLAVAAGVPLAPGSDGPISSADDLIAFGERHGYPVLVKASYGGGGRGMREISSAEEAADAYASAVREAAAAFGNGRVYCERYLVNARHVELQIFADNLGNTIYLGDRDCSVQRRHQKLIEEAPAPGLSTDLRRRMGAAAVRLSEKVGYRGAGTVEFLVDGDSFYFLEMNTRIQVEHRVTEAVTGIDLVELQLRVASGEPLGIDQDDVHIDGVAIEARVNAEDGAEGRFTPSPGKIASLIPPAGEGILWDGGYESGDTVLPLYDSLIGKLVAWAPNREEAIDRLRHALGMLRIRGVATTAGVSRYLLGTDAFRAPSIDTLWLERAIDLKAAAGLDPLENRSDVEVAGHWLHIPYFGDGAPAPSGPPPDAAESTRRGKHTHRKKSRKPAADGTVRAPMQGTIVKVNITEGDTVTAGQVLFVLEAMKMENPIPAAEDGVIAAIHAQVGQTTPSGTLLAEFAKGGE